MSGFMCYDWKKTKKEAVFIKDMEDNQILKKKSQIEYYKNIVISIT
mgnify:CR=1 FL=1